MEGEIAPTFVVEEAEEVLIESNGLPIDFHDVLTGFDQRFGEATRSVFGNFLDADSEALVAVIVGHSDGCS